MQSGWLDRPLLADRVGRTLVSGGDVEIAARVRAGGHVLWYAPELVLSHRIEPERASRRYLLRVAAGLGASEALVSLLTWSGSYPAWRRQAARRCLKQVRFAGSEVFHAARRRHGATEAAAWSAYALGVVRGTLAVTADGQERRTRLLGAAAPHHGRG